MKKLSRWIAILLVILSLASCTWNMKESPKTKTPTGYPADQVQNDCIFYNGTIYWQGVGAQYSSNMREVGTVRSVDNYHLPSEEFAASHLKVGDKVLILEEANELRLFVQRTDVNRLEEFFCASK